MAQVKLLSITIILTTLIWVSADSLVTDTAVVDVALELVPEAGVSDMILTLPESGRRVELQISGPRKVVEDIVREAPLRVRLRLPNMPTGPGDLRLDRTVLKEQLSEQRKNFRRVTIVGVYPQQVPVEVDHWVREEVELVLRRLTLAYDVEPQFQPRTVAVRMRETQRRALGAAPLQLDVTGEVERLLRDAPAAEPVNVTLALGATHFGSDASFTPRTVSVTATVKAQRAVARIPTVPILVAVSFSNLERPVRPVMRDGTTLVTRTITVTGSVDDVSRLQAGTTRAFGLIHLKQSDLEDLNKWKVFAAEYHLPAGIRLVEEPPSIELKLIDISKTE